MPIATDTLSIFITWSNESSETLKIPTKGKYLRKGDRISKPNKWNPNNSPVNKPPKLAAAPLAA